MTRLIDADALKGKKFYSHERHENCVSVYAIDMMPTIEPDRPHGEWIIRRNKQGAHMYSVCSKCNVPHLDTDFPNFCENCGSDNRKKEGDENDKVD